MQNNVPPHEMNPYLVHTYQVNPPIAPPPPPHTHTHTYTYEMNFYSECPHTQSETVQGVSPARSDSSLLWAQTYEMSPYSQCPNVGNKDLFLVHKLPSRNVLSMKWTLILCCLTREVI